MADFRITAGIEAAGWMRGLGDTLRASGNALAVLMLTPTIGKPLVRIRILATVAHLEFREHTAKRTSRGTWVKRDSAKVAGFKARDWAKLTKLWAWRVAEWDTLAGGYDWATDSSKDKNRCGSLATANAQIPTRFGQGRGRNCKGQPNQALLMGWQPASGKACRTHRDISGTSK